MIQQRSAKRSLGASILDVMKSSLKEQSVLMVLCHILRTSEGRFLNTHILEEGKVYVKTIDSI